MPAAAIDDAYAFGSAAVELTAFDEDELEGLLGRLDAGPLPPFRYVSVHGPIRGDWERVAPLLERLPERVETVVLHPDVLGEAGLALLEPLGGRLCFENMDCAKADGRLPAELDRVFAACPDAGFCLDVAHVWTNDPTLALGEALLDRHGDRLRQLHLSGIEPDGTHRPTTQADLELYAPLLDRCAHVPFILEAPLA